LKALIRAVRAVLQADGILVGICTGGIHTTRGQDDATRPYLIVTPQMGWPPDYYTSRQQTEVLPVRFAAFSRSAEAAIDAAERVEAIFRTAVPVLDVGTCLQATKSTSGLELDPDPDDEGNDIWQGIVEMDFLIQRDPTA
jgi:hypothetical protein